MSKLKSSLSLVCLLSTAVLLSACNKNKEPSTAPEQQKANNSIGQLNQAPIKSFPTTADDGHDIALLDDYDHRFTEMSDSMEMELAKMKKANTLTPEFELQRQKDNAQSAQTMLKELDLKTEQGRYIQGLLYDYWEYQSKILAQATLSGSNKDTDTSDQVNHLNEYLHAQSQLHHWKSTLPTEEKMQEE